ncbi:hypothetical protein K469DRAFT_729050 [Zopfia rhizophila CBS 207.26]|uniref:Xylanolytic transcriptional activator regulatory domain-containing protein n=1 Tax=Zopfia rhizophila CBS 207.26 TaxID=1314779 RepID=A0A6A6DQM6_9PEZI|nr:hypothetical protein K469DRAFT_729050 [Zopfia rhizophila CBS 207.26]
MATPRRKACVECRQQKENKTPHEPCSRCRRMGVECRILPTSTRNLRQTKAEMRRELDQLRWNIRQANDPSHMLPTPTSDMPSVNSQSFSPRGHPSVTFSNASGATTGSSLSPSFGDTASNPISRRTSQTPAPTLPRALDGYVIDSKRIEDCYTLFFTQYHSLLPILDPSLTPNDYYDLSPFLLWSIIVTGSRRYAEDQTILDKLSQLITPLAFSSMALRSTPIPVIQGLLILCTWRLPTNSMYKDMTYVLCGVGVHLATQIGLHVTGVGQDFARIVLEKDQEQAIFRAKLWMYCVIVSIRSSCAEGIPPLIVADSFFDGDEREREEMLTYLPPQLQFLHKIHVILLRAMTAMVRTDLKSINCDASVLRSLISIFDSQLVSLGPSSQSELADLESLTRLYSLCISTIQTANLLTQTTNFSAACPSFIDRTLTLAGFAILKISRSPLAQHLDLGAGEQAYFAVIQSSKNMSLQNNDLGARTAAIMTQLWGSSKVFRRKDGKVESLGLRLRTRLSMSVSFDMFWYWREEFGNMSNPYNGEEGVFASNTHTQPATPQTKQQTIQQTGIPPETNFPAKAVNQVQSAPFGTGFDSLNGFNYCIPPMLDQFPDYDWATSFDLSNDWPSGPLGTLPEANGFNFS